MRPGVRVAVDVGTVRVGVAVSDPAGILATPATTLARNRGDLDELSQLVTERDAIEVLVGLPVTLAGHPGAAAAASTEYARALAGRVTVPVRLVDERLSTVGAQRDLRAAGVDTRKGRTVVDQAAAVIILQTALDAERATGDPPGRLVAVAESDPTGRTSSATEDARGD